MFYLFIQYFLFNILLYYSVNYSLQKFRRSKLNEKEKDQQKDKRKKKENRKKKNKKRQRESCLTFCHPKRN